MSWDFAGNSLFPESVIMLQALSMYYMRTKKTLSFLLYVQERSVHYYYYTCFLSVPLLWPPPSLPCGTNSHYVSTIISKGRKALVAGDNSYTYLLLYTSFPHLNRTSRPCNSYCSTHGPLPPYFTAEMISEVLQDILTYCMYTCSIESPY